MCVPIFLQKFSVGREFFLSPTLNIIQPIQSGLIALSIINKKTREVI